MTEAVAPGKAALAFRSHNPDVLTCIANLSNDEVFTPPELANQMLDEIERAWAEANDGASIWANPNVTFLDPFTKSGVFLREVVVRLTRGLEDEITDLWDRVDHILTKQVYGIGITRLTALLARRSVYCSKDATGEHSIARTLERDWGNVWFERTEHTWAGETCVYCPANRTAYGRGEEYETHAYAFTHTSDVKTRMARMFGADVHFDVIIGNPPYQLGSDGGTRDVPIYHHFVEQAKKLEPRLLAMVIQSRWMTSGLGLSTFRQTMLADPHLRSIVDYPNSNDVFPGTGFRGGVCHFLWDSAYGGKCLVTTIRGAEVYGPVPRDLSEFDVFVRDARALSILRKVLAWGESSISTILSADKEFGWTSNFDGFHDKPGPGDVPIHYVRKSKRLVGYIERTQVVKSAHLIDTAKVLVPKAGSGGGTVPDYVLSPPLVVSAPSTCTQTFLFFHVDSVTQAESIQSYLSTKFLRFLVSLRKITQDATKSTYTWVPIQEWDRAWVDGDLYAKYGLTDDEIFFLESQIRDADWVSGGVGA